MAISMAQTGKGITGVKGKLRSGSKKGPKVTNPKQAVAIVMSEGRKAARRRA